MYPECVGVWHEAKETASAQLLPTFWLLPDPNASSCAPTIGQGVATNQRQHTLCTQFHAVLHGGAVTSDGDRVSLEVHGHLAACSGAAQLDDCLNGAQCTQHGLPGIARLHHSAQEQFMNTQKLLPATARHHIS